MSGRCNCCPHREDIQSRIRSTNFPVSPGANNFSSEDIGQVHPRWKHHPIVIPSHSFPGIETDPNITQEGIESSLKEKYDGLLNECELVIQNTASQQLLNHFNSIFDGMSVGLRTELVQRISNINTIYNTIYNSDENKRIQLRRLCNEKAKEFVKEKHCREWSDLGKIKGNKAELEVKECLKKRVKGRPALLLNGLKCVGHLENLFKRYQIPLEKREIEGDIILIIPNSKTITVELYQVKGFDGCDWTGEESKKKGDKTLTNIEKAMTQLSRDVFAFKQIIHYLLSREEIKKLRIETFCFLPNVERPSNLLCGRCHNFVKFKEDLNSRSQIRCISPDVFDLYQKLLTVYCGRFSTMEYKTPKESYKKENELLEHTKNPATDDLKRTVDISKFLKFMSKNTVDILASSHEIVGKKPQWIQKDEKEHMICYNGCRECFLNEGFKDVVQIIQEINEDITVIVIENYAIKRNDEWKAFVSQWFNKFGFSKVKFDEEFTGMSSPSVLLIKNKGGVGSEISNALSRATTRLFILSPENDLELQQAFQYNLLEIPATNYDYEHRMQNFSQNFCFFHTIDGYFVPN